jgi:hypothetical protein
MVEGEMGTNKLASSEETKKAKDKRDDIIWMAAIFGICGAWIAWLFVPTSGLLQILVALVVGGACAYAGARVGARAK